MREKVFHEQRSIRPAVGIGHATHQTKIVSTGVEDKALSDFIGITIRDQTECE